MILVVNPKVPVKTVPELIAYAKANPGKLNMASGGVGSTPHLAGELFKMLTGVNMLHVPYRGERPPSPTCWPAGPGHVRHGPPVARMSARELRGLAVTSAKRLAMLPDLPPVADFVPGYEAFAWQGLDAPKDTPPKIVATLTPSSTPRSRIPRCGAFRRSRRHSDPIRRPISAS